MNHLKLRAAATLIAALAMPTGRAMASQASDLAAREAKCSAGDYQECQMLGGAYDLGLYAPKDPIKARSAYERGCKPDDWYTGSSCMNLFKMLSLGEGGPKDLARAAALAPTVCNSKIVAQEVYLESYGLCKK